MEEILGTTFCEAKVAIAAAGLQVVPFGKGKAVDRGELNTLAAKVAFTGEALARSSLQPQALHGELMRMGVERMYGAWSRRSLLTSGWQTFLEPDRKLG